MPTYAYACKKCDHRFDAVQSFADPSLTECPVCDGELRKQYGSIGVTFNGSGFYRTDSRASGEKSGAKSGEKSGGSGGEKKSSDSSGSGASSSTSTSSKSETKASSASAGA